MADTDLPDDGPASADPGPIDRPLGAKLRSCRVRLGLKQKDLAADVSITAPTLSSIENGQRTPSVGQTLRLALALKVDPRVLLPLRGAQEAAAENVNEWPEPLRPHREQILADVLREAQKAEGGPPAEQPKERGRKFGDFPEAFADPVIVTGDRRELHPKSAGDVGIYSASPIDDRWGHWMRLPSKTEKVSDKEFAISTEERLRREYGRHTLIVVGSPASNYLARIINPCSVFRYNISSERSRELEDLVKRHCSTTDPQALERAKRENLSRLKFLMRHFYTGGIVDPVFGDVRAIALGEGVDFATITFAPNPYYSGGDFKYVAVMLAGFHHPGTAWAVRMLAEGKEKGWFTDHPYGGVVEMRINQEKPWEERMRHVTPRWDTEPYTKEGLLEGLEAMKGRGSQLLDVSAEHLDICRDLIAGL